MERPTTDEVLSVMHWLKYEGFGDVIHESVVLRFMAVNDLPDLLGSLTREGLLVQAGDRLRLTETGLRRAEELYPLLPPDA